MPTNNVVNSAQALLSFHLTLGGPSF